MSRRKSQYVYIGDDNMKRIHKLIRDRVSPRRTTTLVTYVKATNVDPTRPNNYVAILNREIRLMGYGNDYMAYRKKRKMGRRYKLSRNKLIFFG